MKLTFHLQLKRDLVLYITVNVLLLFTNLEMLCTIKISYRLRVKILITGSVCHIGLSVSGPYNIGVVIKHCQGHQF